MPIFAAPKPHTTLPKASFSELALAFAVALEPNPAITPEIGSLEPVTYSHHEESVALRN